MKHKTLKLQLKNPLLYLKAEKSFVTWDQAYCLGTTLHATRFKLLVGQADAVFKTTHRLGL